MQLAQDIFLQFLNPTQLNTTGLPVCATAMMLRYSFDLDKEAAAVEAAVKQVLKENWRTIDIMPQEEAKRAAVTQVGTKEMGDLIAERIR